MNWFVVAPRSRGVIFVFKASSPRGAFLMEKNMTKITEYYLNKASYIAVDEHGEKININIDYWNGTFKVSRKNRRLEKYAAKLLKKKHKVNFINKILESERS